jgi:predicted ABC-type ATPase
VTKSPKFKLFAGPNGSGKSTLITEISKSYFMGSFINADILEYELSKKKYIELAVIFGNDCPANLSWNTFFEAYKEQDSRSKLLNKESLDILEGVLIWKGEMNSYIASIIASFFRYELVKQKRTFSFETVMSHPSKVAFLSEAKEKGYKTYLYFICTEDPLINIQRVKNRKEMGGHDVPDHLIESRYFRSLEQLYPAFISSDRAFVIDSSSTSRSLILEKKQNNVIVHTKNIPGWVDEYLISKLSME